MEEEEGRREVGTGEETEEEFGLFRSLGFGPSIHLVVKLCV